MEVVKRTILLENSVDRAYGSPNWGEITASTFYINVLLTQNIDDMGLFTDIDFISADTLSLTATTFTETENKTLRLPSKTQEDYYNFVNKPVTGSTDSKIEDLKSYNASTPYIPNFDIEAGTYQNYKNITYSGVSRVISILDPKVYVFDTENNSNMGTDNQVFGLQYRDYDTLTRDVVIDGIPTVIPRTDFRFIGEALNETNVTLSALTKEEYLFGIVSPPEVKNDVFIDRGTVSVMEMHLRLSEIRGVGELTRYGNGFYNITRQ